MGRQEVNPFAPVKSPFPARPPSKPVQVSNVRPRLHKISPCLHVQTKVSKLEQIHVLQTAIHKELALVQGELGYLCKTCARVGVEGKHLLEQFNCLGAALVGLQAKVEVPLLAEARHGRDELIHGQTGVGLLHPLQQVFGRVCQSFEEDELPRLVYPVLGSCEQLVEVLPRQLSEHFLPRSFWQLFLEVGPCELFFLRDSKTVFPEGHFLAFQEGEQLIFRHQIRQQDVPGVPRKIRLQGYLFLDSTEPFIGKRKAGWKVSQVKAIFDENSQDSFLHQVVWIEG